MTIVARLAWIVAGIFAVAASGAQVATAQIIVTSNIDEFCKSAPTVTFRRTLVYIDLGSLSKDKTDWGLAILNRLELGTREPLTILGVDPNSFEVREVFNVCYPTYTAAEIEQTRVGRGIFDKLTKLDPADQQRENILTFDGRLRSSLNRLLDESTKIAGGKRRNVLGAIAFDKNRFDDRAAFFRVIIYTDGAISDPNVENTADAAKYVTTLVEKYPASFFGADVSVFGVVGSGDKDVSLESKERIFSSFFLRSWAHLRSFSSSLPQQANDLFPPVTRMDGIFEGGGTQGASRLAITIPRGNHLAEGWLAFVVGRQTLYLPFRGEYGCAADGCKLSATASEDIPPLSASPYFRKNDKVALQGNPESAFTGTLESAAREVFKEGRQEVKYSLKFSKP
jgi:hypothetical protein